MAIIARNPGNGALARLCFCGTFELDRRTDISRAELSVRLLNGAGIGE